MRRVARPAAAAGLCLLAACGPAPQAQARRPAPPVHDVATDWRDPLMPSARLLRLRGPHALPVEAAPAVTEGPRPGFLGRPVAEVNAATCPGAHTVILPATSPAAYVRLQSAVRRAGWRSVVEDARAGRLEATRTDVPAADLIARVRLQGRGSRVDLRAISRQGETDGGANCGRISALVAALSASGPAPTGGAAR